MSWRHKTEVETGVGNECYRYQVNKTFRQGELSHECEGKEALELDLNGSEEG